MKTLSPRQVEASIADGQVIVIYAGYALRLNAWLTKHPGGRLAILHMVGRDATDEINVYHHVKTTRLMQAYRIGKVQQPWTNFIPPLRGGVYRRFDHEDKQELGISEDEEDSAWGAESICSSISTPSLGPTILEAGTLEKQALMEDSGAKENTNDWHDQALKKRLRAPADKLSRAAYTAALEQQEIADDIQAYPSLDVETQLAIRREYQALHEQIKAEGHYQCRYSEYAIDSIRWGVVFGIFLYFLYIKWWWTSAAFLGLWWQQIMFTAHDAGHRGITGNFVADTLIGAFIADFCCGLSIGWWKSSHNVHHLMTNMPEHDPDLQNIPLFSTTPTYFKSIKSTYYEGFQFVWDGAADVIVPYQKYLYYPIMAFARFNLYFLSLAHLVSPRAQNLGSAWWTRWVELSFMCCYWAIFGYALLWKTLPDWPTRVAFVLISHGFTIMLHVQITLSHWGMPTADLGPTESFPQRQLRCTMDIDCPEWLDWFHGGLQFQAVHHLFPRVPRHNLRACSVLVKEFCRKTRIKYKCYAFVEGNKVVLSRLEEVSQMVNTLIQCNKHMAETGESGLH